MCDVERELQTVIKFAIVGITGIVVNTGILYILSDVFNIFYVVSSFFAIEASIISNFILNDIWTFGHKKDYTLNKVIHRFVSYQIVSIGGIIINMGTLIFLTETLGLYYLISNVIGICIAFSWNFLVNRKITWGKRTS